MSETDKPKAGFASRLRTWFMTRVMSDVPEELAACEFSCRRTECTHGEWETCPNRLAGGLLLQDAGVPRPAIRAGDPEPPEARQGELSPDGKLP